MNTKPSPAELEALLGSRPDKFSPPASPDDERRAQVEIKLRSLQERLTELEANAPAGPPDRAQLLQELRREFRASTMRTKAGGAPQLYIFDADGTLRRCTVQGQVCPNRVGEWELIPGVKERLAHIDWNTTALGVASNQGGIALGYLDEPTAYQLLCDMVTAAIEHWPPVGSLQLCPHLPGAGCACRKPAPEMLLRICRVYGIPPEHALYVGDQESDREAAQRAGMAFVWAKDFFGWESAS